MKGERGSAEVMCVTCVCVCVRARALSVSVVMLACIVSSSCGSKGVC